MCTVIINKDEITRTLLGSRTAVEAPGEGILSLIGNRLARTNPIDPQDITELVVECLSAKPAADGRFLRFLLDWQFKPIECYSLSDFSSSPVPAPVIPHTLAMV